MNNKDVLVELDIKSFVKDLDAFEKELGRLKDKVDKALPGITYRCASVIWEKILDIITEKDIVLTGTLRRSVHVASPETDHGADFEKASKRKIRLSIKDAVSKIPFGYITQVGTWLRYSSRFLRGEQAT